MRLTSKNVDDMASKCLFNKKETMDKAVVVGGIVNDYAFHPDRIRENAAAIGSMLADLPDEFYANQGGGWSFLNACYDRHGKQWTGIQQQMELLFCLGIAAKKAQWLLPRDMWTALPGSMPYVSVSP